MKRVKIESDCIFSIGYGENSRTLEIEYKNGSVYQYFDVGVEVYERIMNEMLHGEFFREEIVPNYEYEKI